MAELVHRLSEHKMLMAAPRAELEWLARHGTLRQLCEGEVLSSKGVPVAGLFVILSGRLAIFMDRGAGRNKLMEWRGGDITGMLPYSRLVSPPADSVAQEPTEILTIPREQLEELTRECHEITTILVHLMVDRSRAFTSSGLHDEKMVSLGKLSAGLAHELNNPVAAMERSAALLESRLHEMEEATLALGAARLTSEQLKAIDDIREACFSHCSHGVLSPVEQAQREDTLTDWLEAHDVDSALAPPLADAAVTVEALDRMAAVVSGKTLDAVLRWQAAVRSAREISSEIQHAAKRVSGIVTAIKGFTHMDQAVVAEPVDLESSLNNTVTVLRSKARMKAVSVAITLPSTLPRALGFAGELNQIWANLLDNALDAVSESGQVEVIAGCERQRIHVSVVDNGPGIPADVSQRIFEPFFTTKPVGKGTGLGLDIVRRLVVHNDGEIEVKSVPGRTEFRVSLPVAEVPHVGAQP